MSSRSSAQYQYSLGRDDTSYGSTPPLGRLVVVVVVGVATRGVAPRCLPRPTTSLAPPSRARAPCSRRGRCPRTSRTGAPPRATPTRARSRWTPGTRSGISFASSRSTACCPRPSSSARAGGSTASWTSRRFWARSSRAAAGGSSARGRATARCVCATRPRTAARTKPYAPNALPRSTGRPRDRSQGSKIATLNRRSRSRFKGVIRFARARVRD
jgi:hypothetical protein